MPGRKPIKSKIANDPFYKTLKALKPEGHANAKLIARLRKSGFEIKESVAGIDIRRPGGKWTYVALSKKEVANLLKRMESQ